ncbi:hypothetical protein [Kutzneria buriramensis]|uniref:Uncharacterized protein n=1 Tax=Kutzneria buriramensis TaxID=1045776 RepID=A0A3E0HD27_9PSEU|nr:hypothetical protein [Kutzneria buriramensis]REH42686.1 hypothetical protein BCF44_110183 [Kutzneria buriramensis]
MEVLEWIAVGLCLGLALCGAGWLVLDKRQEVRRAKVARQLALRYSAPQQTYLQQASEYTWPIVAHQPAVFYENALTIPIHCLPPHPNANAQRSMPVPHPRYAREAEDAVTEVLPVIETT